MTARTFTDETLRQMAFFQERTGVEPLDCLDHESKVIYVVPGEELGAAVGKGGRRVTQLRHLLDKEVQVVAYSPEPAEFIESVFRPYGVREVTLEDGEAGLQASVSVDPVRKGRAIGRGGWNLRLAQDLIRRHHDVERVVID